MENKRKGNGMKDGFLSDDLSQDAWIDDVVDVPAGMGHSIRPRRVVLQHAKQRAAGIRDAKPLDIVEQDAPLFSPAPDLGWDDLTLCTPALRGAGSSAIPVVDLDRDAATVRAFDLLRTRLRQSTQEHGWINIGVTAPTSGCGNTFTAVNLALSLSRITGSRTILMDFNLRKPDVAHEFGLKAPGRMKDYLSGEVDMTDHLVRVSDTLALGLSNAAESNSAETLQDDQTWQTLDQMRAALKPQLVIYDLPPMLVNDDVSAFVPQLDGVLLVSDGTQTIGRELLECERMLEGHVPLLGVVLNRARASSIPRYA